MEIAKKSQNDQKDQSDPKTPSKKVLKWVVLVFVRVEYRNRMRWVSLSKSIIGAEV